MNIENFKALVYGWCQSQDSSFLKTFDTNNDGVVIKSEFQKVCLTKDNSLGPDLIDNFWNNFDTNCGDGKIKGTNWFNLNAIDDNELVMINGDLDITGDLVRIIDNYLGDLKDYTNTYNYIQGETLTYTKDNNITAGNQIKAYIDGLIIKQEGELKKAIAKDAMVIILKDHTYTQVKGYDPYNDPTLLARVSGCVGEIVIADGEDPVKAVVNYFNNTNSDSDMGKIRGTINSYFSDTASIDSDNNYQKARLNYAFTEQAEKLLSIIEIETLKDQAKNFIDDAVSKAIGELYVKYKGVPMLVFYRANIACGDIGFESTNAGRLFKDYLEGLSLGDFNENDDKDFYDMLVEELKNVCATDEDAKKVADYLANNDKDLEDYQNIVNIVCEYLYNNTDISEEPLYEVYIIEAVLYGLPDLGLGLVTGIIDDKFIADAGAEKKVDSADNEENSESDAGSFADKISTLTGTSCWGGTSEHLEVYKLQSKENGDQLTNYDFNTLYQEGGIIRLQIVNNKWSCGWNADDAAGKVNHDSGWWNLNTTRLRNLGDFIINALSTLGADKGKLQTALNNVIIRYREDYKYPTIIKGSNKDEITDDAVQKMKINNKGVYTYFERSGNVSAVALINFKTFVDDIIAEYDRL